MRTLLRGRGMRTLNFPLPKIEWVNVLMLRDCTGGICGKWSMPFERHEIYRVDTDMAKIFLRHSWAEKTDELPVYVFHVDSLGAKKWVLEDE